MKKPTALGAHIYAGGFTLGVARHFDVLAHLEEWTFGTATVEKNLGIKCHVGPPDSWPVKDYAGKVAFVYHNAPCAPWSQLKGQAGGSWQQDPRVQHWMNCLGLIERIRPRVWAGESVRGIYKRGRPMLEPFILAAQKKGYRATHVLVNALEHGVPQHRPRYFLVLSQVDLPWLPTGLEEDSSIAEAWSRLPKRRTEIHTKIFFDQYLKHARPGEDLRATFNRKVPDEKRKRGERGQVLGRPPFSVKRLREEGLSHVITGGRSFVHPTEHRFLTVEEQAALCGYPASYEFQGAISGQYAQIGKAVMPPVAEYLARVVAMGLKRNRQPPVLYAEEVTVLRDQILRQDVDPLPTGVTYSLPTPAKKVEPVKTAKAVKTANQPRPPGKGSGFRIREMLLAGKSTEDILKIIHQEFPQSRATSSDVSWNRAKLRDQGGVP